MHLTTPLSPEGGAPFPLSATPSHDRKNVGLFAELLFTAPAPDPASEAENVDELEAEPVASLMADPASICIHSGMMLPAAGTFLPHLPVGANVAEDASNPATLTQPTVPLDLPASIARTLGPSAEPLTGNQQGLSPPLAPLPTAHLSAETSEGPPSLATSDTGLPSALTLLSNKVAKLGLPPVTPSETTNDAPSAKAGPPVARPQLPPKEAGEATARPAPPPPTLAIDLPHPVAPPAAPAPAIRQAPDIAGQIARAIQSLDPDTGGGQPARIVLDHYRFGPLDLHIARTDQEALQLSLAGRGEEIRILLAESLALRQQLERGPVFVSPLHLAPSDRSERPERSEHMRNNTYNEGRQSEARSGDDASSNRGDGQRRDTRHPEVYHRWQRHRPLS